MSDEPRPLEEVLGDTMGKAFDNMDAGDEAPAGEQPPAQDTPPPEDGAGEAAAPEGQEEDTEQEPEAPETAASGEETPEGEDPPKTGEDGAEALSAPEHWVKEDRDTFTALPRETQEFVLHRDLESERRSTEKQREFAEQKRGFVELEQLLEPRRQHIAQQGLNQTQYLDNLLQMETFALTDPAGFVKWFAGQRGIQLDGISEDQAGSDDPAVAAVNSRMDAFERSQQQAQVQSQQSAQDNATAVVTAWAAKDGHEHYQTVEAAMTGMIPGIKRDKPMAGPEELLEEAYKQAIWANPSIREKLLASERKVEETKRLETAKQAAAKAKKAGVNAKPTGSPSGGEKVTRTMEETMGAKYDEMNAA